MFWPCLNAINAKKIALRTYNINYSNNMQEVPVALLSHSTPTLSCNLLLITTTPFARAPPAADHGPAGSLEPASEPQRQDLGGGGHPYCHAHHPQVGSLVI